MRTKSMFDSYEGRDTDCHKCYCDKDRIIGSSNVQLLRNIKGDEIGIRVKENSTFTLYFSVSLNGTDETAEDLLANAAIKCEILNKRHKVIMEPAPEVDPSIGLISITLTSVHDGDLTTELCYGNYYIRLYLTDTEGIVHPLFSETDGVLSIE